MDTPSQVSLHRNIIMSYCLFVSNFVAMTTGVDHG